MLRLRSWASSRMIVSYWRSIRSRAISASRTPSVISLTSVPVAHLVGEPDLAADDVAQRAVQLLGDPLGDAARGDPAGLGVPDPAPHAAAQLEGDLRQLGGLARAGLPGDDDDLGVAQRGGDVVAPLR